MLKVENLAADLHQMSRTYAQVVPQAVVYANCHVI